MAVTAQTPRNVSTAAPGAVSFAYDFKILSKEDLLVQVNGVTKTVDVHFTISGVGQDVGGDIEFIVPLVGGETVLRKRNMVIERLTDFQHLGDLRSPTLNSDQDAPVMMIQQVADDLTRTVRIAAGASIGLDLEIAAPEPNRALVWSSDGLRLENGELIDPKLRVDLGNGSAGFGSSLVKFLQTGTNAVARTVQHKLRDMVNVMDYGAVGDGAADDTAALLTAMVATRDRKQTLNFGDSTKVYRVTQALELDHAALDDRLSWKGNGAKILFDPPAHAHAAIKITLVGGEFAISGIAIDADRNANAALLIDNLSDGTDPDHYARLTIDDVHVFNPRRVSTAFLQSADGMYIRGAYARVVINRAYVRNSVVEAGMEVPGSYGAFGITVSNRVDAAAQYVALNDCVIDGVFSTDNTYTGDQDGLRVFDAGDDVSRLYPWETFVSIKGGEFRNCRNRSIKIQTNFATISGVSFYRDASLAAVGGVGGREIDFQVGGGVVTDINCLYINHVPERLLHLTGVRIAGKKAPGNSVKGVRAQIVGATEMPFFAVSAAIVDEPQKIVVSDVEVLGALDTFLALDTYAVGVTGKPQGDTLLVRDIVCSPATAFITIARDALAGATNSAVFGSNCINVSGSDIPFVTRADTSALCLVSAHDCYGFTIPTSSHGQTADLVQSPFQRVTAIAPASTLATGVLRPHAVTVAAGATVNLPVNGYSPNVGLILACVGGNVAGNAAILAVNRVGATVVSGGPTWVAGALADPGSGDWRVWSSGDSVTGLYVKNNTATSRVVTFYMFG